MLTISMIRTAFLIIVYWIIEVSWQNTQTQYFDIGSDDADLGYMLFSPNLVAGRTIRVAINSVMMIVLAGFAIAGLLWAIFVTEVLIVGRARYYLEAF